MDIVAEQVIWFPDEDVYYGRQSDEYTQFLKDTPLAMVIELVQKRAKEDGEWAITNNMVGENNVHEARMRWMMGFVSSEKMIKQCVNHVFTEGLEAECSVDYVCRDLATASNWAVKAKERREEQAE